MSLSKTIALIEIADSKLVFLNLDFFRQLFVPFLPNLMAFDNSEITDRMNETRTIETSLSNWHELGGNHAH